MAQFKNRFYLIALAGLGALFASGLADGADKPAAVFDGKDTLLRPEGYREWVFVGSSLGLRYDENAEKVPAEEEKLFHNVYLNPAAYREFSETGKFPDGTVLVLEIASAETKKEAGLQGLFQKEFVKLEAAVKDTQRFKEGWAYFSFDDKSGKPKDKARPFPPASCYDCHHRKAATDHVFTQFYPVLRTKLEK